MSKYKSVKQSAKKDPKLEKRRKTITVLAIAAFTLFLAVAAGLTAAYKLGKFLPSDKPQVTPEPLYIESAYVRPPARIGEERVTPPISKGINLESLCDEADAVLLIRVGNWLSEDENSNMTRFEAEVIDTVRGSAGERIELLQEGTSKKTLEGYPLYTGGNELLVFVKKAEAALQNESGTAYSVVHGEVSTFYTAVVGDKDRYCVPRDNSWGRIMPVSVANIAAQEYVADEIFKDLSARDPVYRVSPINQRLIYSYSALKEYIVSLG